MLNRTTLDLDSPSVRVRLFGGRTAEDLAYDYPMAPVDAPEIPAAGPHLVAQARAMGDPEPLIEPGKKKPKTVSKPTGPWLTALVRSALYQPDTAVAIGDRQVQFQTGVLCDGRPSGDVYGPGPCRLVIVGKCLGQTEVDERRPFCGRGSQDLWKAWVEAGLPAHPNGRPNSKELPLFMTNIARFAPTEAEASKAVPKGVVQDGVHLLWQEFAVCRPDVVLLFGSDAVKAVLGRNATITDYRGRVAEVSADFSPSKDSVADKWTARVVVCDHPAAVARDPDKYPVFLSGMRFLARTLGYGPRVQSVPTDYQMVLTVPELEQAVLQTEKATTGGGYVSVDCEWEGAHPSDPDYYLYTVQWSHAPGHARVAFLRRCGGAPNPGLPLDKVTPLLNRLLTDAPARGARLVGHFGKADLVPLAAIGVDLYEQFVGPCDDDLAAEGARTGAEKTYTEGAFDTYVAAHAVNESRVLKLESMVAEDFGEDRYDAPIMEWKTAYCKEKKISKKQLKGYGGVPESVIHIYASKDADFTGRQYLLLNGDPRTGTRGRLDRDAYGLSCRKIFATRMRAWAAVAEMERYGMEVDRDAHRELTAVVVVRRDQLLDALRTAIGWPDFAPSKLRHKREFLFGETYSPGGTAIGPQTAQRLYLTPYKATMTTGAGKLWDEAVHRCKVAHLPRPEPAVDKETLTNLARIDPLVQMLLDIDTLNTALKIMFRPPDEAAAAGDADDVDDPEGAEEEVHTAGLMSFVRTDGRVRTMIGFVETGRMSSSRPNLQNVGSAADEKYNKILQWGEYAPEGSPDRDRVFTTRALFRARAGWYLVDADLMGAEISAAGWNSNDPVLIRDAERSTLGKKDPEWLDLHSDLAKNAFGLTCPLADVAKLHKPLRVAAKRARFGHYYGASPETIHRQCLLDSPDVTLDQVRDVVTGHDRLYPKLADFFRRARARVKRGWMMNGYGGIRRFRPVTDRELVAAQEREGQNWTCQGLVADHICEALGRLWYALHQQGLRSRIVLAVHDSIVCECPPEETVYVHDTLLPWAMGSSIDVVPTDFDGRPTGASIQHFGVDVNVYQSWGVKIEGDWRQQIAESIR